MCRLLPIFGLLIAGVASASCDLFWFLPKFDAFKNTGVAIGEVQGLWEPAEDSSILKKLRALYSGEAISIEFEKEKGGHDEPAIRLQQVEGPQTLTARQITQLEEFLEIEQLRINTGLSGSERWGIFGANLYY